MTANSGTYICADNNPFTKVWMNLSFYRGEVCMQTRRCIEHFKRCALRTNSMGPARLLVMFSTVLCFLARTTMAATTEGSATSDLSEYRWKHRIVITSCEDKPECDSVVVGLEKVREDIEDFNLKVFIVFGEQMIVISDNKVINAPSYTQLKHIIKQHHTVLIGLDGDIKMRAHRFSLSEIFAAIEKMPMYRADLKSR